MKKRILACLLAVCMSVTVLASCGGDDSSSKADSTADSSVADSSVPDSSSVADDSSEPDSSEDDSSEPEVELTLSEQLLAQYPASDSPIDVTAGCTENMLGRALIYQGDLTRLANVIKSAKDDLYKRTYIGMFGDSISAGSGASNGFFAYGNLIRKWWEENVSVNVLLQQNSIGATDSYLAVHRFDNEVAEFDCNTDEEGIQNPDIIIIEYINDEATETYKETMDSLVRKALALPNNPAVIIMMPSTDGGYAPQDIHLEVAQHYEVPFISFHDAVQPEIKAGNFTWADISPDTVHPNDAGHAMMAQMVEELMQYTIDNMDTIGTEVTPFDPNMESLTGDKYATADLADRKNTCDEVVVVDEGAFTIQSSKQWPYINDWATYTGGSCTFEITAKNIGFAYYKTTSGRNAVATVEIDGEVVAEIDGNFPGGWGNYTEIASLYTSDEVATHTVTITVPECGEDEHAEFYIQAWLFS